MRIRIYIVLGIVISLFLTIIGTMAQEDVVGSYDPNIHYYRESMGDINTLNVRAGTLSSLGTGNIVQPYAVEAGGRFFPQGRLSSVEYHDNIRYNACGEDIYVDFYYVPETVIDSNGGATDTYGSISSTSTQLDLLNGLNGVYYCVGGYCTISLCTTSQQPRNPGSLRFSYN